MVSPANARRVLGTFIRKAKKELLIYDPKVADPEILRLLKEREAAGVKIQIIGRVSRENPGVGSRTLSTMRLHTRTIIRDRRKAFVGSQSLRAAELDSRREVGLIISDAKIVNGFIKVFESDWAASAVETKQLQAVKLPEIKKTEKALVKELSPLSPVVKEALKAADSESVSPDPQEVKATVKEAVKEAVRERVNELVKETLEES